MCLWLFQTIFAKCVFLVTEISLALSLWSASDLTKTSLNVWLQIEGKGSVSLSPPEGGTDGSSCCQGGQNQGRHLCLPLRARPDQAEHTTPNLWSASASCSGNEGSARSRSRTKQQRVAAAPSPTDVTASDRSPSVRWVTDSSFQHEGYLSGGRTLKLATAPLFPSKPLLHFWYTAFFNTVISHILPRKSPFHSRPLFHLPALSGFYFHSKVIFCFPLVPVIFRWFGNTSPHLCFLGSTSSAYFFSRCPVSTKITAPVLPSGGRHPAVACGLRKVCSSDRSAVAPASYPLRVVPPTVAAPCPPHGGFHAGLSHLPQHTPLTMSFCAHLLPPLWESSFLAQQGFPFLFSPEVISLPPYVSIYLLTIILKYWIREGRL